MKSAQYGNTRGFHRSYGIGTVFTEGARWAMQNYLEFAKQIGFDPLLAMRSLQLYYVPPTEAGPAHVDPLAKTPEARGVRVTEHVIGWKVELWFDEDNLPHDEHLLVEGAAAPRVA